MFFNVQYIRQVIMTYNFFIMLRYIIFPHKVYCGANKLFSEETILFGFPKWPKFSAVLRELFYNQIIPPPPDTTLFLIPQSLIYCILHYLGLLLSRAFGWNQQTCNCLLLSEMISLPLLRPEPVEPQELFSNHRLHLSNRPIFVLESIISHTYSV